MIDCVIDLSHWNTVADWAAIKQGGIVGVLHKATQGTTFVDDQYHERRRQALDAGLLWGAYHFAERGEVVGQVRHFLKTVHPTEQDLLVLDWEPVYDPETGEDFTATLAEVEAFVESVYVALGRWPGLYSGEYFLQEQLATRDVTRLEDCWLWLASYNTAPPTVPVLWATWDMWQYTDKGTVPGIEGLCDRNRWNGTLVGLRRLWTNAGEDLPRV